MKTQKRKELSDIISDIEYSLADWLVEDGKNFDSNVNKLTNIPWNRFLNSIIQKSDEIIKFKTGSSRFK
jgi:hypothetical protein